MRLYVNGSYCGAEDLALSALDRGMLFGDGVFTTLKVEDAVPLFLAMHLDRLHASCRFLKFDFNDPGFVAIISRLLEENCLRDARVKIIVTRGRDEGNHTVLCPAEMPTVMVLMFPLTQGLRRVVSLGIAEEVRGDEASYRHKTLSYLGNLIHHTRARERGFDDLLILDWRGRMCETSMANVFLIMDSEIVTPAGDLPLLNGIMRQNILSLQNLGGYRLREGHPTRDDLTQVEGAFVTSAIVEIAAVSRIEDRELPVEKAEEVRNQWLRIREGRPHDR